MYNSTNIANRIKDLAKSRGVVLKMMLEECGLSKNALSTMLSGNSMPKSENLASIADVLDCSVDYLLGRTENPQAHKNSNSVSVGVLSGNSSIDCTDCAKINTSNFLIYKAIELFSIKKCAVVLQELSNNPLHKYSVQYAGSGKYFIDMREVISYLRNKWSVKADSFDDKKLFELLEKAPILNVNPRETTYKNYANNIHTSNKE